MGYGIATAAGIQGGYATLDNILQARKAEAMAAHLHAEQEQQRQLENALKVSADSRANRGQDIEQQRYAAQEAQRQAEHDMAQGDKLNESIPGDTRLAPTDRAVGYLRTAGVPLQSVPGVPAMGSEFQGPMENGVTPQQAQTGIGPGFLKTASAAQQNTATDNQRAADAERRAEAAQQSTEAYQQGMLNVARQNANTTAQKNAPKPPSPYTAERNRRSQQSVDELIGKVSGWNTGLGSALSRIPGTDATNFAAELNTLKSNIAFNELAQMRESSKTGGALGAVSERELALLESTLGALDARQSPENLRAQLQKIKESLSRWDAAQGAQTPMASHGASAPPAARPSAADLIKKYAR